MSAIAARLHSGSDAMRDEGHKLDLAIRRAHKVDYPSPDYDNANIPTRDEALVAVRFWHDYGGGFHDKLGAAIVAADGDNFKKLMQGFGDDVREANRKAAEWGLTR